MAAAIYMCVFIPDLHYFDSACCVSGLPLLPPFASWYGMLPTYVPYLSCITHDLGPALCQGGKEGNENHNAVGATRSGF